MYENDPERQKKLQFEAFLRRHHKIVAGLLIGFCLATFILPWIFASFGTALIFQVLGAILLYTGGRTLTTAFDSDDSNAFWKAPKVKPKDESEPKA
ncbi:hypothetical protein [Dethiosulfatarculus sandiegensis]|uniref:Uncharacterized protein n=1 Tax=Dethiosulfatarculus sandiegensis TaxID=1429043 RepID=A0A0D2JRV8_9BACT|nr:hypothetical protein [Dethiosulfatarculus sandiegensis]KIX12250.1 hypothetical protein X474_19710 [Dethiosulfatarculus sandiegensis]